MYVHEQISLFSSYKNIFFAKNSLAIYIETPPCLRDLLPYTSQ